jgi:hypothetical protein
LASNSAVSRGSGMTSATASGALHWHRHAHNCRIRIDRVEVGGSQGLRRTLSEPKRRRLVGSGDRPTRSSRACSTKMTSRVAHRGRERNAHDPARADPKRCRAGPGADLPRLGDEACHDINGIRKGFGWVANPADVTGLCQE